MQALYIARLNAPTIVGEVYGDGRLHIRCTSCGNCTMRIAGEFLTDDEIKVAVAKAAKTHSGECQQSTVTAMGGQLEEDHGHDEVYTP